MWPFSRKPCPLCWWPTDSDLPPSLREAIPAQRGLLPQAPNSSVMNKSYMNKTGREGGGESLSFLCEDSSSSLQLSRFLRGSRGHPHMNNCKHWLVLGVLMFVTPREKHISKGAPSLALETGQVEMCPAAQWAPNSLSRFKSQATDGVDKK